MQLTGKRISIQSTFCFQRLGPIFTMRLRQPVTPSPWDLPKFWFQPAWPWSIQDGSIRVDLPNPLYGDTPYTVQPGGCGEPGEYTHVTPHFLLDLDSSSTDEFGPVGNLLGLHMAHKCNMLILQANCSFSNGPNIGMVSSKNMDIQVIQSTRCSTMKQRWQLMVWSRDWYQTSAQTNPCMDTDSRSWFFFNKITFGTLFKNNLAPVLW